MMSLHQPLQHSLTNQIYSISSIYPLLSIFTATNLIKATIMIYCLLNWSLQIFPTLFFYIPANPYSTMQQEGSSKNPNMIIIVLYLKHLMAVYRKRKFLNLQMVLFNIWPFFGFHTQFTPSSFVFSILQLQFHLNFFLSQTFLHTDFVFVSCLAATS